MYAAGVSPFTALVQRPIHLALMATLGFLGVGMRRASTSHDRSEVVRRLQTAFSAVMIAVTLFGAIYLVLEQDVLVRRAGAPTMLDLVAGAGTLVAVLVLAQRATGWGLVTVCALAIAYAFLGPYLPGVLAHRGYGLSRLLQHLYLSTEGIWGVPRGVSADFVYLFVLFGALLEFAGGGQLLIGLASRVAGQSRGGPAKTAALASAIMGSLSGSAVANVVTTGSLTIPLMKRTGFRAHVAAAIEAAASTGGQLMPPVMGAGAFILATWTNIPYVRVAVAAIIPAFLYYLALFAAIHFQAAKRELEPIGREAGGPLASRLHLLLPLIAIVTLLALGRSPMRAAFWGVSMAALAILLAAGSGTVQVAAACAAAGIVVGVASLTGIGLRMSELIVTLSGGHLPIALVLTALGSIVLGMGLPTTAAYVVLAALGAPALTELGVPLLAAHLFIFYFGCLSNVTPPVSLAAYAAAGLAGSPALLTAVTAMALAGAGFLVPFMFVYQPALLLAGSVTAVVVTLVTTALALSAFAAAAVGFLRTRLVAWQRALLALGGIGLVTTAAVGQLAGGVLVLGVGVSQFLGAQPGTETRDEA
jgi:TRAP transporter 4TM/12TM fusion protein